MVAQSLMARFPDLHRGSQHAGLNARVADEQSPHPVAQSSRRLGELGLVARFEQGVTGVRREPAEDVGAEHRHDHRAVSAARLAGQAPVRRGVVIYSTRMRGGRNPHGVGGKLRVLALSDMA